MSYLYRTGNGRNNIAFTTTTNSSTRYLRRTSSGRNNIVWTTIPQGSTYNILNRTGTGRNNIAWANLKIGPDLSATGLQNNMHLTSIAYYDAIGDTQNDWNRGQTNKTGTSGSIGRGASITYSDGKITFGNNKGTRSSGNLRSWNKDIFDQYFYGYHCVYTFCSQSPPSDYLNAITAVTDNIGNKYNVRYVKYGLKWAGITSGTLALSLDTDDAGWLEIIWFT